MINDDITVRPLFIQRAQHSEERLHRFPLRIRQLEIKNRQVLAHVSLRAGSGQWHDVVLCQISKQDLWRRPAVSRGQLPYSSMSEHLRIGAQRPETLIDDPMLAAERPNHAVVSGIRVETILDHSGFEARRIVHLFQLLEPIAVTDSELSYGAGVHQ